MRAGLVISVDAWPWSSYRSHVGLAAPFDGLASIDLLERFLDRESNEAPDFARARRRYAEFVEAWRGERLWRSDLPEPGYLGDARFVDAVRRRVDNEDTP